MANGAPQVFGISQFLDILLVVNHDKLPGTLSFRGGRHQGGTEDEADVIGINLLLSELTV
jgi:hypothetical protein